MDYDGPPSKRKICVALVELEAEQFIKQISNVLSLHASKLLPSLVLTGISLLISTNGAPEMPL